MMDFMQKDHIKVQSPITKKKKLQSQVDGDRHNWANPQF